MNRHDRRAVRSALRTEGQLYPESLIAVPETEWPPPHPGGKYPVAVWRSRRYLVLQYAAPALNAVEVRRLTVCRTTLRRDGHWDEGISWDDLQRLKRESGHGDWYAVEIYPRERDLVRVANMRHLWLLAEPLTLGWFEKGASE